MRGTRFVAVFLLAAFVVTPSGPAARAQDASSPHDERIDRLFARWDKPDSPGAAVAVVREGVVVHARGYGSANLEYGIPLTAQSVVDIASVSKQFAALAILMLVRDGSVALDDDVRKHLPEVPDFGKTITLRHLLHHTSGLRDWPQSFALAGRRFEDVISFQDILALVRHQKDLNFAPGEEYLYSNTGYNLLAEVVARVTGQSFRQWTQANLFEPLEMKSTSFHDDHRRIVNNRAVSYAPDGKDGYRNVGNQLTALGSSSLYSTAEDLAKWVGNLEHGRVGGAAAVKQMRERGTLNGGERISYAFGLVVQTYKGLTMAGHGGSWAGFRTHLAYFPEQRLGIVVLGNASSLNARRMALGIADLYLADRFVAELPQPKPPVRKETAVDDAVLDRYVGTYQFLPGLLMEISKDGEGLKGKAGPRSFRLYPESKTRFFVKEVDIQVTFARDSEERWTHVTVRQNGRDRFGKRVDPQKPTAEKLKEYAGDYFSEELDTTYRIVVDKGRAVLRHRLKGEEQLVPTIADQFRIGTRGGWIEFFRDDGKIIGYRYTQGRIRNLRFDRRGR